MILFANSILPQIELHTMYSLSRKGCTRLFLFSSSTIITIGLLVNHKIPTSLGVIVTIVVVKLNFCRWFNFRRFYCIKALGNFSQ